MICGKPANIKTPESQTPTMKKIWLQVEIILFVNKKSFILRPWVVHVRFGIFPDRHRRLDSKIKTSGQSFDKIFVNFDKVS